MSFSDPRCPQDCYDFRADSALNSIANSLVLIGGVVLALFQDQLSVNSELWSVGYQESHCICYQVRF